MYIIVRIGLVLRCACWSAGRRRSYEDAPRLIQPSNSTTSSGRLINPSLPSARRRGSRKSPRKTPGKDLAAFVPPMERMPSIGPLKTCNVPPAFGSPSLRDGLRLAGWLSLKPFVGYRNLSASLQSCIPWQVGGWLGHLICRESVDLGRPSSRRAGIPCSRAYDPQTAQRNRSQLIRKLVSNQVGGSARRSRAWAGAQPAGLRVTV